MANALKLLLVDDDALDRLAVKRALAHAGVEAQIEEQAGRGPALQAYALIRKVRSLPDERRNIPAAALTAFANATDRAPHAPGRLSGTRPQAGRALRTCGCRGVARRTHQSSSLG
jgi:hypothetical protein